MRACKDCQWCEISEDSEFGMCRWDPKPQTVYKNHWCAQFHRKETEEGEGKDPNA